MTPNSDDNLKAELQTVDGVGDATADELLDVLADAGVTERDPYVEKAFKAASEGRDRDASMYLRRANK